MVTVASSNASLRIAIRTCYCPSSATTSPDGDKAHHFFCYSAFGYAVVRRIRRRPWLIEGRLYNFHPCG
jgi:hypothetical protein